MSTGLSLIKTLCRQGARSSFRRINPAHFTSEERPVYDFVADYYRRYGQLPTDEALRDQGHNLRLIRDNENADYYIDRLGDRYVVLRARNVIQTLQQAVVRGEPTCALGQVAVTMRQPTVCTCSRPSLHGYVSYGPMKY